MVLIAVLYVYYGVGFAFIAGLMSVILSLFYQNLLNKLYRANIQLRDELEKTRHDALHDGLTTLPNRKYFNSFLLEEIQRAKRYNGKFAIVYMDLDDFKPVNDSYGHKFGDILLAEVGQRIGSSLRESDFAARLGGDEFGFIFLHTDKDEEVETGIARIQTMVRAPYNIDGENILVGASFGVAFFPQDGETSDALLHMADNKMYLEKQRCKIESPTYANKQVLKNFSQEAF